jgi:hypothetical protein
MYNSEKLTPLRIQDGRWKQNKQKKKIKNTHNTICVGHHYAQAKTNYVNKTWSYKQHMITNGLLLDLYVSPKNKKI